MTASEEVSLNTVNLVLNRGVYSRILTPISSLSCDVPGGCMDLSLRRFTCWIQWVAVHGSKMRDVRILSQIYAQRFLMQTW
jgi:hypothetical protein